MAVAAAVKAAALLAGLGPICRLVWRRWSGKRLSLAFGASFSLLSRALSVSEWPFCSDWTPEEEVMGRGLLLVSYD